MRDGAGERRQGLEGLPVNSDEVWFFDAARWFAGRGDAGLYVVSWLIVAYFLGVAIWGRSVVVGVLGLIGLALVAAWTVSKARRRAFLRSVSAASPGDDGSSGR